MTNNQAIYLFDHVYESGAPLAAVAQAAQFLAAVTAANSRPGGVWTHEDELNVIGTASNPDLVKFLGWNSAIDYCLEACPQI